VSNHRRVQPYAWLGAGALTLGLGAAIVGGAAVAVADTGVDTGPSASDSSARSEASPSTKFDAPARVRPTTKSARGTGSASPAADRPSADRPSADRPSADRPSADRKVLPAASTGDGVPAPAAASAPSSAATVAVTPVTVKQSVVRHRVAGRSTVGTQAADSAATSPAAASPAAALPAAAVDPSYNMQSYLPTEPIVPGVHVTLARGEISDAQASLTQQTWGSGNIPAGVASVVPQLLLAEAAWSLSAWQNNMPGASQAVAATVGIPILHQLTQVNLLATMALPSLAEAGLVGAALLLPLVNLLGASTAAAQSFVASARSNGKVYAFIPVQMKAVTEPVVYVSINSGSRNPMLVDTGSSGLIVTRASAPGDLGPAVATGEITFSGDTSKSFSYTTYLTTVDFGDGAVTTPTAVNIVDDADAAAFRQFLAPAGVVGILGTGANTYGPGPDGYNIPNTSLPGELNDGFLLYQGAFLGLFGVMILGPNPLATRVSVPGAPDAYVTVSIDGGPKQAADAIIDSGGVYGTLPANLIGGGSKVPFGTKISVYTADGQTLLYSYTTIGTATPTVVPDGSLMNTGYAPFQQGPVYINYAAPDRIGSTDFAIW